MLYLESSIYLSTDLLTIQTGKMCTGDDDENVGNEIRNEINKMRTIMMVL